MSIEYRVGGIAPSVLRLAQPGQYLVNEKGYYGQFGGAFIPEMLYRNVSELRERYLDIMNAADFQEEFNRLLRDYVGRPSPLYFARRLSEKYQTQIFLKREDLNHTGLIRLITPSVRFCWPDG